MDAFRVSEQEVQEIKAEIEQLRESRSKQRSLTSSVGSSVTIYPAATPTTPSPDDADSKGGKLAGAEDPEGATPAGAEDPEGVETDKAEEEKEVTAEEEDSITETQANVTEKTDS